jgi:hypothetical protein
MNKRVPAFVLLLLVAVLATGCLGPKPVLQSYTAEPPQQGSDRPFRVEAVIKNVGPGDGQVEVEVTLTNKQNGQIVRNESQEVDIKKDEVVSVLFEMNLPPSAKDLDPQQIDVQIDAHYPIE